MKHLTPWGLVDDLDGATALLRSMLPPDDLRELDRLVAEAGP